MQLQTITEVAANHTGLSRQVLEYCLVVKLLVDRAKEPGFSVASWAPLAELVDTGAFERVGNFKEVMNWDDYVRFLTDWAKSSEWDCSFKRIAEAGHVVYLELEERAAFGDYRTVVNSASVYEFNPAGKIVHVDVYLQMEPPGPEVLQNYQGVDLSGQS